MEKLVSLNNVSTGKIYIFEKMSKGISAGVQKRLEELGLLKNTRIVLLHRSKISKGGIVLLMDSKICLDESLLKNIWVREV